MKQLLYIDLFCGAGGTSTGVESATVDGHKCAKVIACVNHDPNAIASHLSNHPEALHFTEDIRTLDLTSLVELTRRARAENPEAMLVLWASLECTNFSCAKGGQPRDADSRTLAEHLFRYVDALKPDYIQIENVREFMMWGDLDENGRPISRDAGRLYLRWVRNMCSRGYDFSHRVLNAADFGAYTSRERFFGIFARKGLPIVFPEPTHSKDAGSDLFGGMMPWKPVRDVLDLVDCGRSIFRDRPLSEKTLQRIYAGLIKFVAGGKDAFLIKWNSMSRSGVYHAPSIDEPSSVITANRKWHYLVNPQFASAGASIEKPCFTLIARMDKRPPYIVTAETGPNIVIYDNDSPMTVKIKEFMSMYGISDICMRMLKIPELKKIMGFPGDYVLVGTQTEQKKYIGNAVEVHQAAALASSLSAAL